jgi:AcrR family transcriptional regulator
VSLLGALVAFVFLPARAESDALSELIEGAAQHLDPVDRQGLAIATLATLADAGMASLTYSGIAARSGIGVATLQRHWTSRIDAVTDAVREVVDQHPIPDTGDLRRDLDAFITTLAEVLQDPYKKRVLGVLIAEAATSPELATAFRERVIGPRRAQLIERLQHEPTTLRVPAEAAVDMLIGPIYHRVMFLDAPVDRAFLDADLAGVLADASAPSRGIG